MVNFIKSHVRWKLSFSVWFISGLLLCFKQAKSHLSPKLQVRYLLLAKSAIHFPCCKECNVDKVYEQGPVPFFPLMVGQYDSSKRSIRLTPPILSLHELMRCGCVTCLAPYFCPQVHNFSSYLRQSCRAISQCIPFHHCSNCMCLFLSKLFALN